MNRMVPQRLWSSLKVQFLLVLFCGAVVPLALIGGWLVWTSARAGEDLLQTHLDGVLEREKDRVAGRWRELNGDLLLLSENDVVWRLFTDGPTSEWVVPGWLAMAWGSAHDAVQSVEYMDPAEVVKLHLARGGPGQGAGVGSARTEGLNSGSGIADAVGPRMTVTLPVRDEQGLAVGTMRAEILIPAVVETPPDLRVLGATYMISDLRSGESVLELQSPGATTFYDDDPAQGKWIVSTDSIPQAGLALKLAAPLAPFVVPFQSAARTGWIALLVVSLMVVTITAYLVTRITSSIGKATRAAEAIAGGDLDHRIANTQTDEVGRLLNAINRMAEGLRTTLDALSKQRTLAALGEFATSMAHEVRNAHTSVGVDLERALKSAPTDATQRTLLERSLSRVQQVNRTVDAALRIARSGQIEPVAVAVQAAVANAVRTTEPWFAERNARLVSLPFDDSIWVMGDPTALETLFVNVLRNAAQAMDSGGEATISVSRTDEVVDVTVTDTGRGMTVEQVAKAFYPFSTTRPDGTGLGLPIARQIALAHGGDLKIRSTPGMGTVVSILIGRGIGVPP